MHIIVEGPDNVGKSTLIKNLQNYFNDEVFMVMDFMSVNQLTKDEHIVHNTRIYSTMFKTMNYLSTINCSSICDRSHLGEMVYGNKYRGYDGKYVLDIEKEYIKEQFFDDVYLILLTDSANNLIDRDDGLSESIELNDKINELNLFNEAFLSSNIKNKHLFNVSELNEKELLFSVIDRLGKNDFD